MPSGISIFSGTSGNGLVLIQHQIITYNQHWPLIYLKGFRINLSLWIKIKLKIILRPSILSSIIIDNYVYEINNSIQAWMS